MHIAFATQLNNHPVNNSFLAMRNKNYSEDFGILYTSTETGTNFAISLPHIHLFDKLGLIDIYQMRSNSFVLLANR